MGWRRSTKPPPYRGGRPVGGIIAPNPALSQSEADTGNAAWMEKYGGPTREPAILPFGTVVTPLSWSPSDSQMVEARKFTLIDVANAYNLDGYWLGAERPASPIKGPGPAVPVPPPDLPGTRHGGL